MIIKTDSYFDGEKLISGIHYVKIKKSKILEIWGHGQFNKLGKFTDDEMVDMSGLTLLPGWIDIHINGGGGVMFNGEPTTEALRTIIEAHAGCGITAILPTLLSDSFMVMDKGLEAVNHVIKDKLFPGVLGIHFEGPFINPKKKGTHQLRYIKSPEQKNINRVLSYEINKPGKKIITVAPEKFSVSQLRQLKKAGYLIMAGHTNARIEEIEERQSYIDGVTHFFNGMGGMSARLPGMVGYALNYPGLHYLSLIVDQIHSHPSLLSLLFKTYPSNRIMMITDAMASVGMKKDKGQISFMLQGKKVTLKDRMLVDDQGVISGANLTMIHSVNEWLELWRKKYFNIDLYEVFKMLSLYPAQFLGLDRSRSSLKLGRIKPGYEANITVVSPTLKKLEKSRESLKVVATLSGGKWLYRSRLLNSIKSKVKNTI